jgi:cytochrome b561
MTVDGERPTSALADEDHNQSRTRAVSWGAAVVVAVGIVGQIRDSSAKPPFEPWLNVHALFGLLLCTSIIARFYWLSQRSAVVPQIEINAFARRLSRMVYLLLYGLLGVKQIINITIKTHHPTLFAPVEDFQVYLAYGLLALVLIHVLAAVCRHSRAAQCDTAADMVIGESVAGRAASWFHTTRWSHTARSTGARGTSP